MSKGGAEREREREREGERQSQAGSILSQWPRVGTKLKGVTAEERKWETESKAGSRL